jgi:acyl carrier protein
MDKFAQIAEDFLHIPRAKQRDTLTPADVKNWDSMNYLLFIAELEKQFDMSFTMDEVMQAKTLGDVKKYLVGHGKKL